MTALLLLLFPAIASLIVFLLPKKNALVASLVFTILQLGITLFAATQYLQGSLEFFTFDVAWISSPNIHFHLFADGPAFLMLALTSLVYPLIIFTAKNRTINNENIYFGLLLLMQFALNGVFLANDAVLYYVFWELTLIPAYFLLMNWGGENRSKVTFKFFVYTLAGSLFMLIAFVYLYAMSQGVPLTPSAISQIPLNGTQQTWIFAGLLLAFAIKIPIIPLHTWQANTYKTAPVQGTMVLGGLMAKMGIFSIYRWILPSFPNAIESYGHIFMMLAVAGVVYGSVIAIKQDDIKKLLAFSSLAHMGLMAAGIFANNESGVNGAFVQAFAHGINTVGLFFCADIIQNRLQTNSLSKMGGIRNVAPKFATVFYVIMFASVALPFTNTFIGEVVTLYGVFSFNPFYGAIAALSLVLGAVYMMRMFRKAMLGETTPATQNFQDLTCAEQWVLYPIVALIFIFGILYQPLFAILA